MSHLPLDARAILQYLNELGYRNISAEQLKEFMKGMQRQSEISSSSRSKTQQKPKGSSSTTTHQQQQQQQQPKLSTTPNRNSARALSPKQQQQPQRTPVKIIKSKKPLIHFKFYLDICDHQQAKKIEDKIKQLGGTLEFFLKPSVTHFITDKSVLPPTVSNNNNTLSSRPGTPQTPCSPATPLTPYSHESPTEQTLQKYNAATPSSSRRAPSIRQSRADAILNRARRGSVVPIASSKSTKDLTKATTQAQKVSPKLEGLNSKQPYTVWQTEQALRFLAKVQHDLKDVLAGAVTRERKTHHHHHSSSSSKSSRAYGPTYLKGNFIKIESLKRNYRPYYQLFKKPAEWPKIELTNEDGAFRLSPKKELCNSEDNKKMTRKSRSRSSQQQQAPLPAAVQALKKTTNENSLKSSGQKAHASNAAITCKEAAKESSEKQCGVCEICKIEYDTLTIHLKTKDHEYFAKNSQNFIALDTLINSSADVNKFLEDEKRQEMELEEMEVEEQDANSEAVGANDPLEDAVDHQLNKRYNSDANTPSPTLREKSKRSTKGKHSSEKFHQNQKSPPATRNSSKSPKSQQAAKPSPPKKQAPTTLTVNTRNKTAAAASAAAASTVYSPPLRVMLPPSSMYKVVDATQADVNTPSRKTQAGVDATTAVNSPSLIVKFKKVREAELCRLSGEADRFMFRKQRTSSELPTDLDRQTSSDHIRANNSSTSPDSSINDAITPEETEKTETRTKQAGLQSKAIAIGRRRKDSVTTTATTTLSALNEHRRFPSAPIQPEIQLKHSSLMRNKIAAATTRRLSVPEATRKSSRTATAIVTAATTSSRLLRAAVEAAKKAASNEPMQQKPNLNSIVDTPTKMTRSSRLSVVKVEDRMGDINESKTKIRNRNKNEIVDDANLALRAQREELGFNLGILVDDDLDEDDEITEDDSEKDEDFIINTKLPKVLPIKREGNDLNATRHTTREQRAARRWTQRFQSVEMDVDEDDIELPISSTYGKRRKLSQTTNTPRKKKFNSNETKSTPTTSTSHIKKVVLSSPPQRYFDIMKSQRLSKLRYSFERLPVSDLWYRVYTRQDASEERYFEYYGSTQYRKLPYEMGPIPFDFTLDGPAGKCCTLCQNAGRVPKQEIDNNKEAAGEILVKKETISSQENSKKVTNLNHTDTQAATETTSKPATMSSYTHKHKKLHLLQRYHQELMQEQQKQVENQTAQTSTAQCDSKASTPEREAAEQRERDRIVRAGSTQSNTSSCTVSSTGTINSKHKYRNKHLNKAALLNLELPPRKSPREHASTLALVSCIIRQRQDSLSKTNSETDEPALQQTPASPLQTVATSISTTTTTTTTTPLATETTLPTIEDDVQSIKAAMNQNKTPNKVDEAPPGKPTPAPPTTPEHRSKRSAAVTPVEELRFATEISENVKRMRRGQNKYDHSPPIVLKTARPTRGKSKPSLTASPPLDRRSFNARTACNTPNKAAIASSIEIATNQRRRPRSLLMPSRKKITTTMGAATKSKGSVRRCIFGGRPTSSAKALKSQQPPSIRKTGTKKGVLEFEVDTAALKALKAALAPQPSPRQLAWEIDKYLEETAKDVDCEDLADMLLTKAEAEVLPIENATTANSTITATTKTRKPSAKPSKTAAPSSNISANYISVNTPPPTDCFSSDFDLCDLFSSTGGQTKLAGTADELHKNSKSTDFSLYSSVALQNYFRRRKVAKSNRTGWPKAQKKKTTATTLRHQHLLRQKSRYLPLNGEQKISAPAPIKTELNQDASTQDMAASNDEQSINSLENAGGGDGDGDGVMTPPDSELDDNATMLTNGGDYENDDDDGEFLDAIDDTATNGLDGDNDVDCETIADSIEIERCCTADLEGDAAVEADIEAEDEANDDDDDDDDDGNVDIEDDTTTMFMEQRCSKRRLTLRHRSAEEISPILLKRSNSLHPDAAPASTATLTSTPTRATAPTTVGTANMLRGLRRTPVLLNGSLGSCISPSEKAGDNSDIFTVSSDGLDTDLDLSNSHTQAYDETPQDNAHCPHRTPKRKYDISKYTPNNKNARTCAAEAATAAVKSLAISQFLKKEVRVTCRRLRPPFRRFRFRR